MFRWLFLTFAMAIAALWFLMSYQPIRKSDMAAFAKFFKAQRAEIIEKNRSPLQAKVEAGTNQLAQLDNSIKETEAKLNALFETQPQEIPQTQQAQPQVKPKDIRKAQATAIVAMNKNYEIANRLGSRINYLKSCINREQGQIARLKSDIQALNMEYKDSNEKHLSERAYIRKYHKNSRNKKTPQYHRNDKVRYDKYGNYTTKPKMSFLEFNNRKSQINIKISACEQNIQKYSNEIRAHNRTLANLPKVIIPQGQKQVVKKQAKTVQQAYLEQINKFNSEKGALEQELKKLTAQKTSLETEYVKIKADLEQIDKQIALEKGELADQIAFIQAYAYCQALRNEGDTKKLLAAVKSNRATNFEQLQVYFSVHHPNLKEATKGRDFRKKLASEYNKLKIKYEGGLVVYNNPVEITSVYKIVASNFK